MGAVLLGASAIKRILDAQRFEGFVLLIGSALIVQGVLARHRSHSIPAHRLPVFITGGHNFVLSRRAVNLDILLQ